MRLRVELLREGEVSGACRLLQQNGSSRQQAAKGRSSCNEKQKERYRNDAKRRRESAEGFSTLVFRYARGSPQTSRSLRTVAASRALIRLIHYG